MLYKGFLVVPALLSIALSQLGGIGDPSSSYHHHQNHHHVYHHHHHHNIIAQSQQGGRGDICSLISFIVLIIIFPQHYFQHHGIFIYISIIWYYIWSPSDCLNIQRPRRPKPSGSPFSKPQYLLGSNNHGGVSSAYK